MNSNLRISYPMILSLSWEFYSWKDCHYVETVGPEGTFCDTVQVPSGAGDMQLI